MQDSDLVDFFFIICIQQNLCTFKNVQAKVRWRYKILQIIHCNLKCC